MSQENIRVAWTRQQLLVAFNLYCSMPFGKMHSRNPDVIKQAELIGRTPSALAMKLVNIASLDPEITKTGRSGLTGASISDKKMWQEMQSDWSNFVIQAQQALVDFGDNTYQIENDVSGEIDYTGNNKTIVTTTRVGQKFFRRSVLSAYNSKCCITGLAIPNLLVASHIMPWRVSEKK